MDKPTNETAKVGNVDVEALSHNIARLIEEGGKALSAYLKPREEGKIKGDTAEDITDVVKSVGRVAEYWMSDPRRALELQTSLGRAYLELWASAVRRMAGEQAEPVVAPDPRDKRFADPEWSQNQFFDFLKQAYLLGTQWAERLVKDAAGVDEMNSQEGGVLRQANRKCGFAFQLRFHQSRIAARDARLERRKSRSRHAYAFGGHHGRARHTENPPV